MGGSRPAGLSGHGPACQAKLNVRPGRPTWQAGLAFGNPGDDSSGQQPLCPDPYAPLRRCLSGLGGCGEGVECVPKEEGLCADRLLLSCLAFSSACEARAAIICECTPPPPLPTASLILFPVPIFSHCCLTLLSQFCVVVLLFFFFQFRVL